MTIQTIFESPTGDAVPVKVWTTDIDELSARQLKNLAGLPFIHRHVAAMPDVHAGKGATVGTVIATRFAIIPAAVGVDIGCGMVAVRTSLTADDLSEKKLQRLFNAISKAVPVGRGQNRDDAVAASAVERMTPGLESILAHTPEITRAMGHNTRWQNQVGSLGGGNHFIEVCLDEADAVWIMLHSGSRGIGNAIGTVFIEKARQHAETMNRQLPDKDLSWLDEGSPLFEDYMRALNWAQDYARDNRAEMLARVLAAMRGNFKPFTLTAEAINCHHNYTNREEHFGESVWVTRKGAIKAGVGDLGIIPGSMGTKSYIVRGRGNAESFCSCSHGAGRRMSRTQASKRYTADDLARQTAGVVCRKDSGVVDEIPGAYKDIDTVMANQTDLVEVVHTLKQVLCVKG